MVVHMETPPITVTASGDIHNQEIILDTGVDMEKWKRHVESFDNQRKMMLNNKVGYGVSGAFWLIAVSLLVAFVVWLRRRSQIKENNEDKPKGVTIELREIPSHKSAIQLNANNTL